MRSPTLQAETPKASPDFGKPGQKHPRKGDLTVCLKDWVRAKAEPFTEQILLHVEAMKKTADWKRDNGQYIPMPSMYLSQQRWTGAELNVPRNGKSLQDRPKRIRAP